MVAHYYLGANSYYGFRSLYDKFVTEDDTLFIIKGSPGSGKSTFMKKIAQALISEGAETEIIHCSGDPDSLDGVYFPQLHIAYVDGTAPHVIEPVLAGVTANYLNFGDAIDMEGLRKCAGVIHEYSSLYKAQYVKAYNALNAARCVIDGVGNEISDDTREVVIKRAMTLCKSIIDTKNGIGNVKKRFIDGLTCRGWEHRYDTVSALTDTVYIVDTASGLNRLFIDTVSDYAVSHGQSVILCCDTLSPQDTAHLIIPDASAAIISRYSDDLPQWNARAVRLDAIQQNISDDTAERLKRRHRMHNELIDEGQRYLEKAKSYHDRLESIYRPYIDFSVLDRLYEKHRDYLLKKL